MGDWSPPTKWSVAALERHPLRAGLSADELDELRCLLSASATDPSRLAEVLAALSKDIPPVSPSAEPDSALMLLLDLLLSARPPSDLAWWRAFWAGLSSGGQSLRTHLYFAVGSLSGLDGLWEFLVHSLDWEDTSLAAGREGVRMAGFVLVRFQTQGVPSSQRILHPSPKVRLAILYSAPIQYRVPNPAALWYGAPEVREHITQLLSAPIAPDDPDTAAWRIAYLGNAWSLSGFDFARADLQRALATTVPDSPRFDQENVTRFMTALLRIRDYDGSKKPLQREWAQQIRAILAKAVEQAPAPELDRLIAGLSPVLDEDVVRNEVLALMSSRLHQLDRKSHMLLGR